MTKKKKRKRPAPGSARHASTPPGGTSTPGDGARTGKPARPVSPGPSRSPSTPADRRSARTAMQAQWIHPPVASSVAKGMQAVGASPLLLGITFLSVLAIWLIFSAYGVVLGATPQAMVLVDALPPIHSIIDIIFLAAGRTASQAMSFAFGTALVVLRSVLLCVVLALVLEVFGWTHVPGGDDVENAAPPGTREDGRRAMRRRVIRRTVASLPAMIAVEVASFLVALVGLFIAGGFLGPLGVIVVLVGGLYFFVYTPVIAVVEGVGAREAARRSSRVARAPGPRHMLMTFSYLALTLFVSFTTPANRVSAATPSILVWGFVLLVSFIHLSMLAAIAYRWLLIRDRADDIPASPARSRGASRR